VRIAVFAFTGVAASALALAPQSAQAQPTGVTSSVDAGTGSGGAPSLASLEAELDADYAQAMASDCALACKALGSMRRATETLCALEPGDRCAKARDRLSAAIAHVKSVCPECAEPLGTGEKDVTPRSESAPLAPAPPQEETVSAESVSKRGGCAGCTTTGPGSGAPAPLALGLLALVGLRRRCVRTRRG
jgi:MYXO-CTERM domain-containing protein